MGKRAARVIAISSGAVIAVAVLAYAAYASTEWVRYGHADHFADNPFLDRFAPHFEVAERLEIAVAAPAAETYGAAVGLDLRRSWIVRSIFRAREAIMRSHPATAPTQHEFLQEVLSGGRGLLAEEPGRRFVLGAVTKPWEADVKFTAIPPERFAAFNEPGFAKIVWTLEVIPVISLPNGDSSSDNGCTIAEAVSPLLGTGFSWHSADPARSAATDSRRSGAATMMSGAPSSTARVGQTSLLTRGRAQLMLAATSMLIGATLTAVYYMSKHPQNLPILIVAGAFVGLCIYGMIDLLFLLFQHSLDLLPQRFLAIAEAAIYVIGGVVGWFIGLIHCQLVFPSTQLVPRISGDVRERSPRPSA